MLCCVLGPSLHLQQIAAATQQMKSPTINWPSPISCLANRVSRWYLLYVRAPMQLQPCVPRQIS